MGQCWQEPAQRVEIEYVYQQLDHMISARRDTVEVSVDFEQRWSELPPNKRASSIDTDLGSRIALAGSFAGSTTTEKSSDTSINIEAVSDLTPSLEIMENSPVPSTHDFHGSGDQKDGLTGAAEIKNNTSGLAGSGDAEKSFTSMVIADIVVESVNQEAVITPVKPVAVTSSTPADSKPSETSEYFSPLTSTPASLYETAIETSKTPESGSKDSVLMGIDSTVQYIDISEDAELTSIKQEINEGEESLHLSGDFNDFVRASPTVKSLDFGDFESSQLDTDVEVSNNKGVPSGISSDFSEFEGASENFSTLGAIDKTADQNQPTETTKHLSEKSNTPQTSQSLSLQFESLNLESLAQINLKDPISDFASETEPQGPQPHDIVVPESFQMSESVPAEQVEASTPGPLLDEDVDKLVQSSHEPEQASLGNISVASLPSEPAQFVIPETTAVLAAQAMAFTGVPEQQHSLDQNLISLPAHVPATEALEASQDSLMAALGESLESHPKSQEQEGSLQEEKVTEDPSGSEKVGTSRKYESQTAMHSLSIVEEEERLKSDLDSDVCNTYHHPPANVQLEGALQDGSSTPTSHSCKPSSNESSFQHNYRSDNLEKYESGIANNMKGTSRKSDLLYESKEKLPIITQDDHAFSHQGFHSLNYEYSMVNGDKFLHHTVCDDGAILPSQHYEVVDPGLLSPDDDTTADSGILSGRQEHFSDSGDDDEDDEDDGVAGDSSNIGFSRTESPFSAPSPADSDSDVSSTSSTSTSGSSGDEYSCDTGHHTARPSLDTGQRFSLPLDTGQSNHRRIGDSGSGKKAEVGSEEETLEMITNLYLSKGVKSPRIFEMRPLETIPEDKVLSSPSLYRDNSMPTSSDTSSLDVKYEDLFGSDGFEWDDLCEDSMTEDLRTNSETIPSSLPQSVSDQTTDLDLDTPISSTRQALQHILSRTGLLSKTSYSSEPSNRQLNSEPLTSVFSPNHPSSSSTSFGLSSISNLNRSYVSSGEISTSLYSLAEDYSFDSDSLSEVCDKTSVHSLDHEEVEDPARDTENILGSCSPSTTPSSILSPELASLSHEMHISDNACGADPLLPSISGKGTKPSHADEVTH